MAKVTFEEMLDAGVHFGHLKRKWNPNMAPYIFMERNGIHIIDLYKTTAKLEDAQAALRQIARSGKKILFVATKKQAKDIVSEAVKTTNMPYITERWAGGMLTNFATIRKAVKKMSYIDKMMGTDTYQNFSKRERLQISRERAKLEKNFGSISDLSRLPAALFIVDINKEHIAVSEAKKLNIPTFALVDTNSDPTLVDFPIPANDDAAKSIDLIIKAVCGSINEGLAERKAEREEQEQAKTARIREAAAKTVKAEEKAPAVEETEKNPTDNTQVRKGKRPRKTANKPEATEEQKNN